MKKLVKLSFLVFIPLVGGLILNFVGAGLGNDTVASIGRILMSAGVPVTMFILVVVSLILMITGKLELGTRPSPSSVTGEDNDEDDETEDEDEADEEEREYSEIENVNSSYGYNSNARKNEYLVRHVADNYKNSSKKEKVLGWLFFAFLIGDFVLIPVFAYLNMWTGMIICFCLFGGTIILSGIIKAILERTSMRAGKNRYKYREVLTGEVKACVLSSMTSVGSSRHSTTRITGVVYRLVITAEGKEYNAYSRKFYVSGESVTIAVIGKHRATVLDDET